MSQTTLPPDVEPLSPDEVAVGASRRGYDEFNYRPVPLLANVSLFLGLASFVSLLGLVGLVVGLLGVVVGGIALLRILAARGQLSGRWLATTGLALSAFFLARGAWIQYSDYVAELPPGYLRVNFPRDIAEKQFVEKLYSGNFFNEVQTGLHPDVEPLIGKKIFIKGYVWPTKRTIGVDSFVLLKDNGECCFGGDPKPYDMIVVQMQNGRTTDAVTGRLTAVAGTLRFEPHGPDGLPLYVLEADLCQPARTVF